MSGLTHPHRPRCGRCKKPGRLVPTVEGPRCSRCYDAMPPTLRRRHDPPPTGAAQPPTSERTNR